MATTNIKDCNQVVRTPARSGMCFLLSELAAEYAAHGGAVQVIDVGQSYQRLLAGQQRPALAEQEPFYRRFMRKPR